MRVRQLADGPFVVSEPQPQAAGLPEAGLAGQGEQGHPGEQVQGDLDDLQPDLILRGAVEREVAQTRGAGGADAVLGIT